MNSVNMSYTRTIPIAMQSGWGKALKASRLHNILQTIRNAEGGINSLQEGGQPLIIQYQMVNHFNISTNNFIKNELIIFRNT